MSGSYDPRNSGAEIRLMGFSVFEKAGRYFDKVAERLRRAKSALEAAGVRYAVIGGNAVMAWVAQADESAIRPTQDVDILLAPEQFEVAKRALESAGFVYRHAAMLDIFLDGPEGKTREAIHIVFAGRKVRQDYAVPAPELHETVRSPEEFVILSLEALVRMKLTSYRLRDQVHLQDMVGVGLIDATWLDKYPPVLRGRLQRIIENPEA